MFYPNIDFKDLWNNDISDKLKMFYGISSDYIVYNCK